MKNSLLATMSLLFAGAWLHAQECPAVSLPYSLDFESATVPAFPDCATGLNDGQGNSWTIAQNPGSGFTSKTLQYTANTQAANAWFFTKGVLLTAGQPYKITSKYGNSSATAIEKFKISFGTAPTTGAMVTTAATHDNVTGGAPTTVTTGPFYVTETGTYYFGFNVFSEASQASLYVDDITVEEWVCELPANLVVTGITTTAATLSWNAVTTGDAVQFYQISVQPGTGVPIEGPTTVTLTAPTYAPLTPATTYSAYVRSFCSGVWSDWSQGTTFTTPACDTFATVPYLLNFEGATAPALPECTVAAAGGTGTNWQTTAAPGTGFTGNALYYAATDAAADTWFFTKGVQLEAGQYYKLSYKYGNSGTGTESFSLAMATGPGIASVTAAFSEHTATGGSITDFVYVNPISVAQSGVYYLAFHATSAAGQGSLFLDDIRIDPWTCDVPTAIAVTPGSVTTTGATLTWTAPQGSITQGYFYGYSTTPTPPDAFTPAPGPTVTLAGLEPGTTYYFFVKSFCGPLMGEWTEPVTFTTEELAGITNVSFTGLKVYPNPAKNSFAIKNNTDIEHAVLYTITGQEVLRLANITNGTEVNIEKLPTGVYLLSLTSGDATKNIKVIKQ